MKKPYQITEYESFVNKKESADGDKYKYLPPNDFHALLDFVRFNNSKKDSAEELFSISERHNVTYITAKNYIGLIMLKNNSVIEVLPKISSTNYDNEKVKDIVVDMLSTLKDTPFKQIQSAKLKTVKMSMFDVFVRMFIDKIYDIVKLGLKCGYQTVESNEKFFKGKIKFSQNIKYNYAHKERNFVEYDEFNDNRSENKLIKSTLIYLYKSTLNYKNKNDLKVLLSAFQNVDESADYKKDFKNVNIGRNMHNYEIALIWCKVFLMGESFTSYSGSKVAFALLFPMESLFESYIAYKLKKALDLNVYSLSAQDKKTYLFDEPKKFRLIPDIVIKNNLTTDIFVMDTKWKLLNENQSNNYGISQSDMYQMYAYQKKYNSKSVTLLYPYTDKCDTSKSIEYKSKDDVIVYVRFVDLFDVNNSLKNIVDEIVLDNKSDILAK